MTLQPHDRLCRHGTLRAAWSTWGWKPAAERLALVRPVAELWNARMLALIKESE